MESRVIKATVHSEQGLNPGPHLVMLLDTFHQVLPEDLPALQEARGRELGGIASLCKAKNRGEPQPGQLPSRKSKRIENIQGLAKDSPWPSKGSMVSW